MKTQIHKRRITPLAGSQSHGRRMRRPAPDGFALVVTLSLMVLLAILAVGMLSLSSVALRSSGQHSAQAEAQANARMALMLAIGELQKELGSDQRISARASILDEDSESETADGVANPHWLGVWDSWDDWLNNPAIQSTYDKGRTQKFRRWLVSHPDPVATEDLPLARTASPADSVLMASATDPGGAAVEVPSVVTNGTGRYAWWITGENQKANVTLTLPELQNDAAKLHSRSHWQRARAEWLAGLEKAPTDAAVLARAATLPTYGLGAADAGFKDELRKRFHDLTVDSVGLAANVRHGGLKKDLNLLLELPSLPPAYGTFSASAGSGTIIPIRPKQGYLPTPFYAQNERANNFTSWYKLHQYYQLYRGGGEETSADCIPLPFQKGLWGSASAPAINYNWHKDNLDYYGIGCTPIMTRLMLVYSTRRVESATTPGTYDYRLGVNPVVVMWNPYNVTMHSPALRLRTFPGALQYKAYVDGNVKVDWTSLSATDITIAVLAGQAPNAPVPIVLRPGETRIFSSVTGSKDLTPGYVPPDAGGGFEVNLGGLTGLPGTSRVELAARLNDQRTDHGGQYQMYWTVTNRSNAGHRFNELAANPVEDGKPIYLAEDVAGKRVLFSNTSQRVPFSNFQFVMKSGEDLRNPGEGYSQIDTRSKNFIHANPANQRAMYGEATARMRGMAQYHVHIESGSGNSLNPDFDPANNRAYTGSAISPGESVWPGQPSVVTNEFPLVPVTSIASLMHFKLNPGDTRIFNTGRHLWEISANQALGIGNSFAHPLIAGDAIYQDIADASCRGTHIQMKLIRDFHDHVFLNNDALWDDWFCSGITRENQGLFKTARGMRDVVRELRDGIAPPRNPHLVAWKTLEDPEQILLNGDVPSAEAHRMAARFLMIKGAFNINSTSVEAWKAFLAGTQDKDIVSIDPQTGNVSTTSVPADRAVFSRFSLPASPDEGKDAGDPASWLGVRLLSNAQIDRLARECVRQVKERGPFLNLSEFVNRRLAADETGVCGALQAAIDWDEFLERSPEPANEESINGRFKGGDDFIGKNAVSSWGLEFPQAATGSRFSGIPGYLTQADVLKRVGNMITPRDDTFRIRAYGESRDASGAVRAKSWCEAVVRRVPEYLETTDKPETATAVLTSETNKRFGRRLDIVNFRWLSKDEI